MKLERVAITCVVLAMIGPLETASRAEPPPVPEPDDRVSLVAEAGVLFGGAVKTVPLPEGSYYEPEHAKLAAQAGAEWPIPVEGWRLGGAIYGSVAPVVDKPSVAALFRGTYTPSPRTAVRLAIGPVVTCRLCRGPFRDPEILARIGIGAFGVGLDIEARVTAFDVGREHRPLGTEVAVYAGVTVSGERRSLGVVAAYLLTLGLLQAVNHSGS